MANQSILSLTLKQMRYTVAAAEFGNVTAAAAQLHVSQPSISMAIAAVEAHYGRRLFARQRGQGMTLTVFGRSFVAEAREIQELYLSGQKVEAMRRVPEALLDAVTVAGPPARIRERLRTCADAGVTSLLASVHAESQGQRLSTLEVLAGAGV